jgi:hypothetical protein
MAVFSGYFLDLFIEEGVFSTLSGFLKCALVKLASALLVSLQADSAVVIPPQLGTACDVRVLGILLKSRGDACMKQIGKGRNV